MCPLRARSGSWSVQIHCAVRPKTALGTSGRTVTDRTGWSYGSVELLGGAAAPLIVTALAANCRPVVGGWFMSAMALLSLVCAMALPETKERDLELVRGHP